jgi:hypothetical protein
MRKQLWFFFLLLAVLTLGASYGTGWAAAPSAGKKPVCRPLQSGIPARICTLVN